MAITGKQGIREKLGMAPETKIEKWFWENNVVKQTKIVRQKKEDKKLIIEVNGPVILPDEGAPKIPGYKRAICFAEGSDVIVVSELNDLKLYAKLKQISNEMLDNCLGKSIEDQRNWIGGEALTAPIKLGQGKVKNQKNL